MEHTFENGDGLIETAIEVASLSHKGQVRKGSQMPYILHPMEAATICASMTDDPEIIAAALLHDVVEDTNTTAAGIREIFGDRIASLVEGESEDKRRGQPPAETWKARKVEAIEHLERTADPGVHMVCLGDKLSNIRAIQRDFERLGDNVWQRFNQQNPAEHAWYYRTIVDVLKAGLSSTEAWHEFATRVEAVFGRYEQKSVYAEGAMPSAPPADIQWISAGNIEKMFDEPSL